MSAEVKKPHEVLAPTIHFDGKGYIVGWSFDRIGYGAEHHESAVRVFNLLRRAYEYGQLNKEVEFRSMAQSLVPKPLTDDDVRRVVRAEFEYLIPDRMGPRKIK